jgi:hypothetical protein
MRRGETVDHHWVFIAAFTIDTPDCSSSTGWPAMRPARMVSPLT